MDEQEFFEKLAELAIRIGVNLQPGQELVVFADVEHAPLVRATMEAGWRAGASDVQCLYREPYDRLFLGRYAAADRSSSWGAMRRRVSMPTSTPAAWLGSCPRRG